ncbi:MAG: hypothetical protein ACLSA6_11200 [Holdemania massiliensis]
MDRVQIGYVKEDMNLPEEAIPQFELALQKDPDNIAALSHLAYQLPKKAIPSRPCRCLKAPSLGRMTVAVCSAGLRLF